MAQLVLQLGTNLSNLDCSLQLPHCQGGVPVVLPPGGERTEHLGSTAPPLHLANRRYLVGRMKAAGWRSPDMEEVIGHTWKGDLSHWSIEVEASLPGELGVPCIQESCTQSGMSS